MSKSVQLQDKFMLRLPDGMRDDLKAAAFANERSMNAEIIARLSGTSANFRDQIAIALLSGLCSNSGGPYQANGMNGWGLVNCDHRHVAQEAYLLADAMLAERAKGGA